MKPLGMLVGFSLIASTVTVVNFDTGTIGQTPKEWTVAMTHRGEKPRWEIRRDQTAPTQPYVLAQVSSDPTGDRFPLAILNTLTLGDGEVSVRFKPVGGHGLQGGGVVIRYRDENNYYVARANVLDKTVGIYRVQGGQSVQLATTPHRDLPFNAWTILKISAKGNRIQVFVDHRRVLQAWDSTFKTPGKVGLWTDADAVTYFDDFRVSAR